MKRPMSMLIQCGVGVAGAAALAWGAAWWFGVLAQEGASSSAAVQPQAVRVEWVQPRRRTSVQPARVEPLEQVEMVVKVPGFLKELGQDIAGREIDTGSRVRAGQVLALLHVPELDKELKLKQAALQEAHKSCQAAEENLKSTERERSRYEAERRFHDAERLRYEQLFKERAVEKTLLDEKRSRADAAQAAVASADARIDQARADLEVARARCLVCESDVERLRDLVAYATIRAPQTDPQALYVVTRRWADRGAYLQPGTGSQRDALLSLVRVDRVVVVCDVPELDAAHVEPGDRAQFQASALPGRTFEGRVSRHAAALDPLTRTLRVEIDFDNPDGRPLYTGMYGTVTLVLDEARDIWLVPAASVHRDKDEAYVWILAGDRVEQQPVKIGHTHAGLTEVLSGLSPRAQVVVRAVGKLQAGQAVSASPAKGR